MKILVVGATGQTGRRIVAELVKRKIPVMAMVRDKAKARDVLPACVDLIIADVLNPSSFASAMDECDFVICAAGATPSLDPTVFYWVDYEGTKNLINVAKEKQIEKFILVTSLCVSRFFHPLNLFGLVLFWKKQAENYLIDSGLTYTIIRPGGLRNEDSQYSLIVGEADTLFEGSISRQEVAKVCIESIFYPETNNRILEIVQAESAPAKDWQELFAV
ncbi:SDR family oxidoreductase [Cyanobacterium sp. Dongsha4]|uniref:SDR family oxidoreductase n=1 Tax=Cyanobacterium sp. DS4 TaxID=2878255 RepID=UPI002E7FD879|nr:SDR family oxidoreductase [Cyanobacterium sp. Dongsha4]WVL02324.1 SDR family oxidoreductase [Cyanobacterium sp. Dongsha4]